MIYRGEAEGSVAQDFLMHAIMIKSFLSMWRTVVFPGKTVSQM